MFIIIIIIIIIIIMSMSMQKEYWSVHENWYKCSDHSEELSNCMEVAMSKIKRQWLHNKSVLVVWWSVNYDRTQLLAVLTMLMI